MKGVALAALAGATCAGLLAGAAAAQTTVYRCGPDGRSYSQTPCADGRPLTVEDPRSASQQRAARAVAESEARNAQRLRDERLRRESAARRDVAIGIGPEPAGAAASASLARKSRARAKAPADPVFVGPPAPRPAGPASAPARK